jgi:hypothetical protein
LSELPKDRVVHRVLLEPTVDRSPIEIVERQPFTQRVDLCKPISNGLQIASSHVLLKLHGNIDKPLL